METTAFNTKTSLNPKGGPALLVKTLTNLSKQAVQPGRDTLFAGMLGEKISQAALSGSISDPATAAPGGKHPLNGIAGDPESDMITDSNMLDIENTSFEEALALIKKSLSPTEKAEPTEEAKTVIHFAKEIMEQAMAMPSTAEKAPHADPSPAEKAALQIDPPCEPGAALFAQAVKPQEAARLESATDGAPARNPMVAAPPTPATPAKPASHPDEALQRENDGQRADGAPAKNPMAAAFATSATPATPASHPNEALQRNNDKPAIDGARPDVRQAGSSHNDHWKQAGESKEGASIAAASQKPISAVGDGQAAPERMTPGGSPDKTLPIRDTVTETPGPAQDHQQSRNTTPNHQAKLPERDMFLFRMEMPNVVSPQETRPPAAIGSTAVDMQSVIDQIVEARQGSGNDFGRMRIMLNPPNLGSVDLDIIVRGERVDVVMTAENATVQQALQSRGDDIRIALQRQDLKIEGFQVLLQDNGTGQQQTNSGEMYRQNRENRERFNTNADVPPPAFPVFSPIAGAKSAAGLVSIFA